MLETHFSHCTSILSASRTASWYLITYKEDEARFLMFTHFILLVSEKFLLLVVKNHIKQSYIAYYVPGSVLSPLTILIHLIFTTSLCYRHFDYFILYVRLHVNTISCFLMVMCDFFLSFFFSFLCNVLGQCIIVF